MADRKKILVVMGVVLLLAGAAVGVSVFLSNKNKGKGECVTEPTTKNYYLKVNGKYYMSMDTKTTEGSSNSLVVPAALSKYSVWRFYKNPNVSGALCLRNVGNEDMFFMAGPSGDTLVQPKITLDKCSEWEAVTVECVGEDGTKIAIKSNHGAYVGLNADMSLFVSSANTIGTNETFELIPA